MRVYFDIFKFGLSEGVAYPIEVVVFVFRKLITLSFLLLFWFVVSETNKGIFDFKQLLSYFLISQAVAELSLTQETKYGRGIQKTIKRGALSNYLIKPVNELIYMYVHFMGQRVPMLVYGIISLIVGMAVYPPTSMWGIILFPFSLILTALVGYSLNIFIGLVAFYSPEAGSVKSIFEHVKRILSGALIPLSYFPPLARKFAEFTPFPILAYYPTVILQSGGLDYSTFQMFSFSLVWAALLLISSKYFWLRALKNFDGVGI